VPIDISDEALQSNARQTLQAHPGLTIASLSMAFEDGIKLAFKHAGAKTVLFAGGTVGNLNPAEEGELFKQVAAQMGCHDRFLVTVDLPPSETKSQRMVVNAYRKSTGGLRDEFMSNTLTAANRKAGSDFKLSNWYRNVRWSANQRAVIQEFKPKIDQTVNICPRKAVGLDFDAYQHECKLARKFSTGDPLLVSIHRKHDDALLAPLLKQVGMTTVRQFQDVRKRMSVMELALSDTSCPGKAISRTDTDKAAPKINIINVSKALAPDAPESDKVHAAMQIQVAAESHGSFVVTGHGLPDSVFDDVRRGAHSFFSQPNEKKDPYNKGTGYGFGGYLRSEENGAQLLGDFTRPPDAVESFTVRGNLSDPCKQAKAGLAKEEDTGEGSKPFPMMSREGNCLDLPQQLEVPLKRLQSFWLDVNKRLCRLVQLALNVPSEEFNSVIDCKASGLRVGFYPAIPGYVDPQQMRYGKHTDSGGMTVLALDPDNHAGLQVFIDDTIVDMPNIRDGLVVNLGQLLSHWTGNTWLAPAHQVTMGDSTKPRISIVLGTVAPRLDGPALSTLSSFTSAYDLRGFDKLQAAEFMSERARLHRTTFKDEERIRA
jgi:isopenicillin N synthase-like dioxygenase/uncharacterized SAM-dependent methyltransferase